MNIAKTQQQPNFFVCYGGTIESSKDHTTTRAVLSNVESCFLVCIIQHSTQLDAILKTTSVSFNGRRPHFFIWKTTSFTCEWKTASLFQINRQ